MIQYLYFFPIYWSQSYFFLFILSLLGQNLLFNTSINAFVIGSLEWLTYSGRIGRPVGLCWYFFIAHDLTYVNFHTCITHNPALLELFIAFKVGFPSLGNSDHVVVSVLIEFLVSSKGDVPFHHIISNYSPTDWDGFCDHIKNVPLEVFDQGASVDALDFWVWAQVGTDLYIPYRKYQVILHSSLWFVLASVTAIVYRNCVSCLWQCNEYETKFRPAVIVAKSQTYYWG